MQLIELQQALAPPHITIEQVNMLSDRRNQVVPAADRDIVLRKRPFAARSISTLPRVKDIPLHLGSKCRPIGFGLLVNRRFITPKTSFTPLRICSRIITHASTLLHHPPPPPPIFTQRYSLTS